MSLFFQNHKNSNYFFKFYRELELLLLPYLFNNQAIMHFLYNILLTKIFNLMKKTELRAKVLLFSVVFFFMGMASLSAQYVGPDEATLILKTEITPLEDQIPGASGQDLVNLYFKVNYYNSIVSDIGEGAEVGAAIYDNKPTGKAQHHTNGTVTAANDDPFLKDEIEALVGYVDNLLAD